MAKLKDKIQNALDEGHMLVLGANVLLGFQYRAVLEPVFARLPRATQYLNLAALGCMLLTLTLLLAPAAYHRIVAEGKDTDDLHNFTTSVMDWALLPFALSLGINLYIVVERMGGRTAGLIAGATMTLIALFFWYGLEMLRRARHRHGQQGHPPMQTSDEEQQPDEAPLKDKIRHVLTEARVVLPGAQALLGFQFATFLLEGFDRLPASSHYVHLASLALIALSTVLLMTPAAYHRLVERGEETEHFYRLASGMVLAAMVPLPLGLCGDLFVVVRKVSTSDSLSLIAAAAMLAVFYGFWFGYTLYRRSQTEQPRDT